MSLALFSIFGLLVGATVHCFVHGWDRGGWFASIGLGILGAGAGALLGSVIGLYRQGDPPELFAAVGGSILVLIVYHTAAQRRRWHEERKIL